MESQKEEENDQGEDNRLDFSRLIWFNTMLGLRLVSFSLKLFYFS